MSLLLAALLVVKLPLVVHVYDTTGLSASELELARVQAGQVLTAIGIEPIWPPCHATGCIGRPKPQDVAVRIVVSGAGSRRGSLGFSTIDVMQHAGTLATVYADRVDVLAAEAGVERGWLLGRVIAHEIGHLLLGTTQHARYGVMRALWLTTELQRDQPLDWMFSGREGAEMRRHLMARANVALPEDVVAELGAADVRLQLANLSFAVGGSRRANPAGASRLDCEEVVQNEGHETHAPIVFPVDGSRECVNACDRPDVRWRCRRGAFDLAGGVGESHACDDSPQPR
jgi:hypothetical protein